MLRRLYFFFFLFAALGSQAQSDSLLRALKTAPETDRPEILRLLALEVQYSHPDKFLEYAEQSAALARKTKNKWCEAFCLRLAGIYHDEHGDYKKAVALIDEALAINRSISDNDGVAACLNSLGIIYFNQSKFDKALENFLAVLPFYSEASQPYNRAITLMSIAGVYKFSSNPRTAADYYGQAYRMMRKADHARGLSIASNNLGQAYHALGKKDSALFFLEESLKMKRQLNDKRSLASSLANLSNVHLYYKEYDKAIAYLDECIKLQKETGDKKGLAASYNAAGDILTLTEKKDKALDYFLEAYRISSEIGDLYTMRSSSYLVGNEYYQQGKYREAADYIYVNSRIRDSLYNYDRTKTLAEMQTKYETEKKEQAIVMLNQQNRMNQLELDKAHAEQLRKEQALALLNKEAQMKAIELQKSEAQSETRRKENELLLTDQKLKSAQLQKEQAEREKLDAEGKKRAQQLLAVLIGSLLLLVLLGVAYRGYRQKKKANTELASRNDEITRQKEEIRHQKDIVEEKNKEITDSITYAQRLQQAILPPEKLWLRHLPESFVLYRPKDIVAGDFYWMEENENEVFFAAADCTGHGVPGAMVSMVCSNALNRAVKEFGLREPGKILDKVRELVIETFAKSESEVKDGMDISLCALDKGSLRLRWAGANNPLWIIRYNTSAIEELAPDKQPIGQFETARPFSMREVQLQRGDQLYLLTDGLPDQFGGPRGKKFKYRQLQELLLANAALPMREQHLLLERAFESWKGALEQVDDVCLLGVRI